jgi:hypothetical protein
MMEKRGQAAMEFLMTYGLAILAAIITIAILAWFGVFTPSNYTKSYVKNITKEECWNETVNLYSKIIERSYFIENNIFPNNTKISEINATYPLNLKDIKVNVNGKPILMSCEPYMIEIMDSNGLITRSETFYDQCNFYVYKQVCENKEVDEIYSEYNHFEDKFYDICPTDGRACGVGGYEIINISKSEITKEWLEENCGNAFTYPKEDARSDFIWYKCQFGEDKYYVQLT